MKLFSLLAFVLPVVYALPYSSDWTPKVTNAVRVERVQDSHGQVVFGVKETSQHDASDDTTQRPAPSLANRILYSLTRIFDDFTGREIAVLGGDDRDIEYDYAGVRYEVSTRCDENNRPVRVFWIKRQGRRRTYRVYPVSRGDGGAYCRRWHEMHPEA